jgi:hypothetical protein
MKTMPINSRKSINIEYFVIDIDSNYRILVSLLEKNQNHQNLYSKFFYILFLSSDR